MYFKSLSSDVKVEVKAEAVVKINFRPPRWRPMRGQRSKSRPGLVIGYLNVLSEKNLGF